MQLSNLTLSLLALVCVTAAVAIPAPVGVAKLGDAIVARSLFPVEKRYGGDDEDEEDTKAKSVGLPVSKRYGGDDEDEENTKAKSVELPGN